MVLLFLISNIVAQENKTENWIELIDYDTKKFDKRAKIKMKSQDSVNGVEVETIWYKKKRNIYKIKIIYSLQDNLKIESSYYFNNDLLIKNKTYGVVPIIYKGRKEKEDPCCVISKIVFYFKSKNEAIKKHKEFNLKYSNEYDLKLKEFQKVHFTFKKYNAVESEKEYIRISNLINGLRIY